MHILFTLLLLIPIAAHSQVNRSANEFAREKAAAYITEKLFAGDIYTPITYGLLTPCGEKREEIRWQANHDFRISPRGTNKEEAMSGQLYRFTFYFNERMKVMKAVCYSRSGS